MGRPFLLAWLALGGVAAAAPPQPVLQVPLRVHVLQSSEPAVDAKIDASTVRARIRQIDEIFAPAGIRWVVEEVRLEPAVDADPFRRAVVGERSRKALWPLVSPASRLSPNGVDLYVVGDLSGLGIGGIWMCGAGRDDGQGAAFVPVGTSQGKPIPVRKWAHELGHALGLPHTACEAGNADRLMMSGKCAAAEPRRVAFSDAEIARMRAQAATGQAAPCRTKRAD
ncbi:MAG: hypothetical protein R3F59_38460 [Myxococcota bacterium]